jgi:hypothetical protein
MSTLVRNLVVAGIRHQSSDWRRLSSCALEKGLKVPLFQTVPILSHLVDTRLLSILSSSRICLFQDLVSETTSRSQSLRPYALEPKPPAQ